MPGRYMVVGPVVLSPEICLVGRVPVPLAHPLHECRNKEITPVQIQIHTKGVARGRIADNPSVAWIICRVIARTYDAVSIQISQFYITGKIFSPGSRSKSALIGMILHIFGRGKKTIRFIAPYLSYGHAFVIIIQKLVGIIIPGNGCL